MTINNKCVYLSKIGMCPGETGFSCKSIKITTRKRDIFNRRRHHKKLMANEPMTSDKNYNYSVSILLKLAYSHSVFKIYLCALHVYRYWMEARKMYFLFALFSFSDNAAV